MVRAVNATLDPAAVATVLLDRAATWVQMSSWALVARDRTGQLALVADRGLAADMRPAVEAAAAWVIQTGQDLVTNNLSLDSRVRVEFPAVAVGFPLACRGRRVGALVGIDAAPSSRAPKLAPGLVSGIRQLLEPAPKR